MRWADPSCLASGGCAGWSVTVPACGAAERLPSLGSLLRLASFRGALLRVLTGHRVCLWGFGSLSHFAFPLVSRSGSLFVICGPRLPLRTVFSLPPDVLPGGDVCRWTFPLVACAFGALRNRGVCPGKQVIPVFSSKSSLVFALTLKVLGPSWAPLCAVPASTWPSCRPGTVCHGRSPRSRSVPLSRLSRK